ncbi:MAG: hypothetical protein QF681_07475 [Vicinamibacterales bacterium]|nr:hypothetical protein [Vicinamibacterales bacterium]
MTALPTPDFIEVEGARLYYEDTGLGSPVVMLHGGLLDVRSWEPQIKPIAATHLVNMERPEAFNQTVLAFLAGQ